MENTPKLQENTSHDYYILDDDNLKGPAYKFNELLYLKTNGIITKNTIIAKDSGTPRPAGAFIDFNNDDTINTSGMGNSARLPKELNTFNIGACILSIFWGYSHFPKYRIYWGTIIVIFFLSSLFAVYANVTDYFTLPNNKSLLLLIAVILFALLEILWTIFLIKGNEIAWKNRKFKSIEEFKAVQDKWLKWGYRILALIILILLSLPFTNLIPPIIHKV